jgi:hypothetical protein
MGRPFNEPYIRPQQRAKKIKEVGKRLAKVKLLTNAPKVQIFDLDDLEYPEKMKELIDHDQTLITSELLRNFKKKLPYGAYNIIRQRIMEDTGKLYAKNSIYRHLQPKTLNIETLQYAIIVLAEVYEARRTTALLARKKRMF